MGVFLFFGSCLLHILKCRAFLFSAFLSLWFLTLFSLLSDNIVFSATLLVPQHGVVVVVVELEEVGSKRIRIRIRS